MKNYLLTIAFASMFAACGTNTPQPVAPGSNSTAPSSDARPATATAHTTEPAKSSATPPAASAGKGWSQSGDAIDTKKFDDSIAKAEKELAAKPSDDAAKKALAKAYLERAVALTDARQYASALGDYRRTVKHDPSNAEAKDWIEKIVMIYDGMGRSYPKEGEEPPPLAFKPGN